MSTYNATAKQTESAGDPPPVSALPVTMKYGLPGFESLTRFALADVPDFAPFQMLLSEEEKSFSLLVLDIKTLPAENELLILANDLKVKGIRDASHRTLLVLKLDRLKKVFTVNTKAPIVIDMKDGSGRQMILDNPKLPVDYQLTKV